MSAVLNLLKRTNPWVKGAIGAAGAGLAGYGYLISQGKMQAPLKDMAIPDAQKVPDVFVGSTPWEDPHYTPEGELASNYFRNLL